MNAYPDLDYANAPALTREEAADLISRYPQVSNTEGKAILKFLRNGRHLDVGILTADEKLKPQLDSFMREHASHFRIRVGEGAAVVASILAFLVICWLLWEVAGPVTGHR
jgi:hypothetical protein